MLAQLAHVGAMETAGDHIISASWGQSELTQQASREATEDELAMLVDLFKASAVRCREGNLDGVEVSMAHGMLLSSFLSPLMNHRDDKFGGDVEGRTLFPREVLAAVRDAMGEDRIVGIRIPGDELVDGGIRIEDAVPLAVRLVETGHVDYVSVTAGNNTRKLARADHWPPTPAPHGTFRKLSRAIKAAVDVPVATVGRVITIRLTEEIIASGDADLVGMVRANVADPQILPKTLAGHKETVRPCVGANVCINALLEHRSLVCMVNPEIGRPKGSMDVPLGENREAVVVGAGPAGLEAARRLALRGVRTRIVERDLEIGGQLRLWSDTPSRREFRNIMRWWIDELQRLDVSIELGVDVTAQDLLNSSADLVVVATGSKPLGARIDSDDDLVPQFGVYDAPASGGHILVRDEIGKLPAMLTAERLAQSWRKVTLVTSALNPGEGEGLTTAYTMIRTLAEQGITLVDRAYVRRLQGRRAILEGVFGEERSAVEDVDAAVSLTGLISENSLVRELRKGKASVTLVGDAVLPRDVEACVRSAAETVWDWAPPASA